MSTFHKKTEWTAKELSKNCKWIAVLLELGKLNSSHKYQEQFILTWVHMLEKLNATIYFTLRIDSHIDVYIETNQKKLSWFQLNEN